METVRVGKIPEVLFALKNMPKKVLGDEFLGFGLFPVNCAKCLYCDK